ncbi:tetratricopeptide repeat protein [bacterium]|nr:tetratricopeptide repeat protein [bacterium]
MKNDNPKYYLTMVEIYYNTERYDEALAYMEKIIKLRPTNPKYLLATAELYEQIGDIDNAKKYYFTVLEYEQNNEKAKAKIKEFTKDS